MNRVEDCEYRNPATCVPKFLFGRGTPKYPSLDRMAGAAFLLHGSEDTRPVTSLSVRQCHQLDERSLR
jgi:hypothetical protein